MKIDLACPSEVWRCKLIDKEGSGAEVTLNNLGDKPVTSTEVTLVLHSKEGDETSRVLFRAHDLYAQPGEPYDFIVPLPQDEGKDPPSKVEVFIEKIWYSDGLVWRRGRSPMTEYRPNTASGRDLEMLHFVAGDTAVGFPEEQENVWLCVCGRPNDPASAVCAHCGQSKEDVFRLYNRDAVEAAVDAHHRKLELHARATREAASRKQAEQEKVLRKKTRKRRRITRFFVSILILLALGYGVYFHLLPYLRYRHAVGLMNSGSYTEAIDAFSEMSGYLDADELLLRSRYEQGKQLTELGTESSLLQAHDLFAGLDNYLDSASQLKHSDYLRAALLLNDGRISEASSLFTALGNYLDSPSMVTKCSYQRALQLFGSGEYADAEAVFESLGEYEDSVSYSMSCRLEMGRAAIEQGDPDLPDVILIC